jgi:glycosyltransferase involved in cell wall biosynthesis
MRIAILTPHIFMHRDIMPDVIFAPGSLAIDLCNGLTKLNHEVTLFSPGPVDVNCENITADLSLIDHELMLRGYGYTELLKKHPLLFANLTRQIQSEIISKAYQMANEGKFNIIHVFMNEEELALSFAKLCNKPIVFTHHEPFNFLAKYRSIFPKYKNLNWVSLSLAQRKSMPEDANWAGNVYNGHDFDLKEVISESEDLKYFAYLGRIIEPKGVHLAIQAVRKYNLIRKEQNLEIIPLYIAGKHYSDISNDKYWETKILPEVDNKEIFYKGFINNQKDKLNFLSKAMALLIPSTWDEPFGMVMIEALASGIPLIGLGSGAIPEVIKPDITGFIARKEYFMIDGIKKLNEKKTIANLASNMMNIDKIDSQNCIDDYKKRFTVEKMVRGYEEVYRKILDSRL